MPSMRESDYTNMLKDTKNLFDNSNILILLFKEKVDLEPFTSIYEISETYLKSGVKDPKVYYSEPNQSGFIWESFQTQQIANY